MTNAFSLRDIYGDKSSVSIEVSVANELQSSLNFFRAMSEIEDLFSLVSNSYAEFERLLFETALQHHIQGMHTSHEPVELFYGRTKDAFRQRLLSLLSAYRALCDQAPQRLGNVEAAGTNLSEIFNIEKSAAFDTSLDFRICDGLRNVMTHESLPLSNVGITSKLAFKDRLNPSETEKVGLSVQELLVPMEFFLGSGKFRNQTKKEISRLGFDAVDLKAAVRGFISHLFQFREKFQGRTEELMENSEGCFEKAYSEFREETGSSGRFLELWTEDVGGEKRLCPIKETLPDLVRKQRLFSQGLRNVASRYPSVEVTERNQAYQGEVKGLWRR